MDARFKLTPKQLVCVRVVAAVRPDPVAAVYIAAAFGWDRAAADHRLRGLERRGFLVGEDRSSVDALSVGGWTPPRRVWTLGPLSDALMERGVL